MIATGRGGGGGGGGGGGLIFEGRSFKAFLLSMFQDK